VPAPSLLRQRCLSRPRRISRQVGHIPADSTAVEHSLWMCLSCRINIICSPRTPHKNISLNTYFDLVNRLIKVNVLILENLTA